MKKTSILVILLVSIVTACVPAKKFNELEQKHKDLQQQNERITANANNCEEKLEEARNNSEELLGNYERQKIELQSAKEKVAQQEQTLENLQESYDALEEKSSSTLLENSKRNRALIAELEEKQNALTLERKQLAERSAKIKELENLIAAKEEKMQTLKNSVSAALTNFEGKGLTVERRNGKVYVSMENKLLFDSGSWAVGSQGKQAVQQLAMVLAENPDINVLIEGHTDNVPYNGNGALQDNWDLSTKRATSIVHLLQKNSSIDPERLTAAGRGEYAPLAKNTTPEGKAMNRRIEVILTPKLDEVSRLLEDS